MRLNICSWTAALLALLASLAVARDLTAVDTTAPAPTLPLPLTMPATAPAPALLGPQLVTESFLSNVWNAVTSTVNAAVTDIGNAVTGAFDYVTGTPTPSPTPLTPTYSPAPSTPPSTPTPLPPTPPSPINYTADTSTVGSMLDCITGALASEAVIASVASAPACIQGFLGAGQLLQDINTWAQSPGSPGAPGMATSPGAPSSSVIAATLRATARFHLFANTYFSSGYCDSSFTEALSSSWAAGFDSCFYSCTNSTACTAFTFGPQYTQARPTLLLMADGEGGVGGGAGACFFMDITPPSPPFPITCS